MTGSAREAAHAIAQSFRGAPLANDTAGQQVDQAFEALVTVGAISTDPRRGPGPIGAVALAVGRLPYGHADQVRAAGVVPPSNAEDSGVRIPLLRDALIDVVRGFEFRRD